MKKLTIMFLIFVFAAMVNGCALLDYKQVTVESCGDPTGSVIHEVIADPQLADVILSVANFEGIESGLYTKAKAEMVIDAIEGAATNIKTYNQLALFAMSEISKANSGISVDKRILLVGSYLKLFVDKDLPITDYDRCLILKHIANQRAKVLALL